jgi:cytochrome c peroxidase
MSRKPSNPYRLIAPASVALLVSALFSAPGVVTAQNPAAPPSLKTVPVPQPYNLDQFVKSRTAALALGKALFWDMQVGSDAVQSCATCHFHAGADNRTRNAVSPGLNSGDTTFQSVPPNGSLSPDKFPFTMFSSPDDRTSPMMRSWNDVVSSPGVHNTTFTGQPVSGAAEQGISVPDPVFNVNGVNTRRVEPRNAPTVINAVFNFANFWDARANNVFNGSSPLGAADPDAGVWMQVSGLMTKQRVAIPYASLASQAVGPPGSPFEMSFAGRTFPDIGKKLLNAKIVPLGNQSVHPRDSVLGSLAKSTIKNGRVSLTPGLNTSYAAMVKAAFNDQYWNSALTVKPLASPRNTEQFSQMEANFALFFGLAIQVYETTLISDDSPFDRFQSGDAAAMSPSAREGLNIFLTENDQAGVGGNCINCHGTSTFTNASVMHVGATNFGASIPEGLIERMTMGDGGGSWYDSGYYDIGVRPLNEDSGRGNAIGSIGNAPLPLSHTERALINAGLITFPMVPLPFAAAPLPCGPGYSLVCPVDNRVATAGAFKVPTLRNIELTGPYMHNGGESTLMQVMDFYGRGGNFFAVNAATFDPDVQPLFGLNSLLSGSVAEANQRKVIDFLLALTDDRVRWEKAPFDHPELFVPDGTKKICGNPSCDNLLRIPPVGVDGLSAEGLPAIGTFLGLDPKL